MNSRADHQALQIANQSNQSHRLRDPMHIYIYIYMTLARSTQNASSGTQIRNFTTQFQNAAGCLYPNQIIALKRTQNATSQRRFKTQLASDPKRNAQLHNATETQPKRNQNATAPDFQATGPMV